MVDNCGSTEVDGLVVYELQASMANAQADLADAKHMLSCLQTEQQIVKSELVALKREMSSGISQLTAKISATSRQHAQAPALFDGADRRRLENDKQHARERQLENVNFSFHDMVRVMSTAKSLTLTLIGRAILCGLFLWALCYS